MHLCAFASETPVSFGSLLPKISIVDIHVDDSVLDASTCTPISLMNSALHARSINRPSHNHLPPCTLSDELWIIHNLSYYQNYAGSERLSNASPAKPTRCKHSRPRLKEIVLGAKHQVGRPPKTLLESAASENAPPHTGKRKVGRPLKIKHSGGVVIDFGPINLPAVRSCLNQQPQMSKHALANASTATTPGPLSAVDTSSNSDVRAPNPTQHIIPDEDPQRVVEIDDVEGDGVEDGIREEDVGRDGDDEDGDERDPADDDLPPIDKQPPCIHRLCQDLY